MKKLTAGIFASILGLTAMGAADAAVTSKAYVDGKVEAAVASKADQSALTQEIAAREAADATLEGKIALKADESALADKQDLLTGDNFKRDASETGEAGNVIASIIVDNGTVTYKTATVETSEDTAELRQRVADVEASQTTQDTEIEALQTKDTELAGLINAKADTQTVTDLATTVSGKANADDVYTKEAANAMFVVDADLETYVTKDALTEDQNKQTGEITTAYQAADASLKSELEGKIDTKADSSALADYVQTETYNAGQTTQNEAIAALQTKTANMATTTDVDTAKAGAISEAAADAATKYAKIAYEGKVDALETKTANMATTTDVDTAKAGAISEAAADAATKYAKIAYEEKVDALETSQATQNTAIEALQGFESGITDAAVTDNGSYVLTKIVSTNAEGQQVATYGWELIQRDEETQK